jgi:endoribonuclease LACTB2
VRKRAALLALDGEGRCLTITRAGEGVHRGHWVDLPDATIDPSLEMTLERIVEAHFGEGADHGPFTRRGTFHGRGDAFNTTIEVYGVRIGDRAPLVGAFTSEHELAERWRMGQALLSPALAAHVAAPEGAEFERDGSWEVSEGVIVFPMRTPTILPATHTNAFLFAGDEAVIIEPASPDATELARFIAMIEREREQRGFRLREILVTHHHPDHVGGARYLAEHLDLPMRAHRATVERLDGSIDFDGTIEDGEVITLGRDLALEAIHTPGHAPGHLCFLERRSGALVAGDMVAGVGTILVEKVDGDMALYLDSLARMKALSPTMLLPAHGGVILSPAEFLEFYRAHRLMREAKVLAALRGVSPATVDEILPHAYDDAPKAVWPLAALSLEAHLIKLESDGLVRRDDELWIAR